MVYPVRLAAVVGVWGVMRNIRAFVTRSILERKAIFVGATDHYFAHGRSACQQGLIERALEVVRLLYEADQHAKAGDDVCGSAIRPAFQWSAAQHATLSRALLVLADPRLIVREEDLADELAPAVDAGFLEYALEMLLHGVG